MIGKQDLLNLKQRLKEAPQEPPARPAPEPPRKPPAPADLESEDALFLAAMGHRAQPGSPRAPLASPPPPSPLPEATPVETFEAAVADLKGLRPAARSPFSPAPVPPSAAPLAPAAPEAAPPMPAPPEPPQAVLPPPPPPASAAPTSLPVRFQLAAGMALEVDGVLDLRGHSRNDAVERLKDRLADGILLGWRSIQVLLGADPQLHEGLLELLDSGAVPMVARYAQAPVPMGGTQAWLLYLTPPA